MQLRHRLIAAVLLGACAGISQAGAPENPLTDCVDLGADQEAVRFGTQYLLISDAGVHYRLHFAGSCDALALASSVEISTDGKLNRLCPRKTRLSSRARACSVRSVDVIDADTYARFKRRS